MERGPGDAASLVVAFATVAQLALAEMYVDLLAALVALTAATPCLQGRRSPRLSPGASVGTGPGRR
jgi:hypothetical protein